MVKVLMRDKNFDVIILIGQNQYHRLNNHLLNCLFKESISFSDCFFFMYYKFPEKLNSYIDMCQTYYFDEHIHNAKASVYGSLKGFGLVDILLNLLINLFLYKSEASIALNSDAKTK